jgi:hypothetical protein
MAAPDRVVVREWFDVFPFDQETTVTCPDCDQVSPGLRDPWAAVRWVDEHQRTCPAGG